ncbi:hypothetical protein NIE88_06680 [Sporolactobacillus shoreicorticis]|uniref:Streptomycin adenylyltransferase n=1 Tax=Sporolactobacillus shoreicorticis TaxID=1923877 RepID=A0ABW5S921_9BACL|nr:hypothetical protein [Sporolactobacillus shoreicorticis]MCO7125453.1 hypothetical protein [Sporolactobacillus shoreicorticis]
MYSDIDLRIITQSDQLKSLTDHKIEMASKWSDILFIENAHFSRLLVVHYTNFIKMDLFFYTPEMIRPSVWLQKIKIIKDSESGFLQNTAKKSKEMKYDYTTQDYFDWRNKCFAHVHEAYRRSMRGEYYYALHDLDALRQLMTIGWYMEKGAQPNTYGDWAKIEGIRTKLSKKELNLLVSWTASRNANEIMKTIVKIKPYFIELCRHFSRRFSLSNDEDLINSVFHRIE